MTGFGVLGEERLRALLLRTAHLPREQREFVAQWANQVLVDAATLENILAGLIEVAGVEDGQLLYRVTPEGHAALSEADHVRDIPADRN